jgi:ABC-type Zn2+ transport system substrate-binding protein/surface adhesin
VFLVPLPTAPIEWAIKNPDAPFLYKEITALEFRAEMIKKMNDVRCSCMERHGKGDIHGPDDGHDHGHDHDHEDEHADES